MNQDEARCKALRSISQWAKSFCTVDDMEADVDAYAQAAVKAALADTLGLLEAAAKKVPGHSVEISWHGAPPDMLTVYWDASENQYHYWTDEWRGEARRRWSIRISRADALVLLAGKEKKG